MAKWKCEVCGNEFENFHAQGFDNKIYCPLCYFKKENQELKLELSGYRQAILEDKEMLGLKEENDKLKKQLEDKENIACNWKDGCLENAGKIEKLENQQKEFIEYMNKTIEECNNYSKYIENKLQELKLRSAGKTYIANEIMKNEVAKKCFSENLSKYKEIIGDINDKK